MPWINRCWKAFRRRATMQAENCDASSPSNLQATDAADADTHIIPYLSNALMHAPMGYVLLGTNYTVLWFNSLAAQWLGLRDHDQHRLLTHIVRSPSVERFLASSQFCLMMEHGRFYLRIQRLPLTPTLNLLQIEPENDRDAIARAQHHFLAAVSHELNTPLTVMHGFLDVLESQPSAQDQTLILKTFRHQIQRLNSLSQQLLQLLRAEHITPRFQHWDALSFFGQIETDVNVLDVEGRTIMWSIDRTLDIYGDESLLYSAFRNLIDNAIRYTLPHTGKIRVAWYTSEDQGQAVFEVQDNGVGIPPEHIPRLGERFFRAGQDTISGTGLGLSIVKQITQQHHAELQIESKPNRGSTFRMIFRPIKQ